MANQSEKENPFEDSSDFAKARFYRGDASATGAATRLVAEFIKAV